VAKYEIQISRSAEKALKRLPKRDLSKVVQAIQSLALSPFPPGCRKLTGEESTFRIRVGIYRLIYEVEDKKLLIWVLKIGHRKDIYR